MAAGGTELVVDVELEPRIANARPIKATNQTTHAPMYHRVVIRLPMAMPPGPDRVRFPYMGNESKRGITCARGKFAGEWQGRKCESSVVTGPAGHSMSQVIPDRHWRWRHATGE